MIIKISIFGDMYLIVATHLYPSDLNSWSPKRISCTRADFPAASVVAKGFGKNGVTLPVAMNTFGREASNFLKPWIVA